MAFLRMPQFHRLPNGTGPAPGTGKNLAYWSPWLIGLVLFIFTLGLWQQVHRREHADAKQMTNQAAQIFSNQIKMHLRALVQSLRLMEQRVETFGLPEEKAWELEARHCLASYPSVQVVEWVDPTLHIQKNMPAKGNEKLLGFDLGSEPRRRAAYESARRNKAITYTGPIDLIQGGRGNVIILPLYHQGRFLGYFSAVLNVEKMFDYLLPANLFSGYSIAIFDAGQPIFRRGDPADFRAPEHRVVQMHQQTEGLSWTLQVASSKDHFRKGWINFDELILLFGAIVSLLVALLLQHILTVRRTRSQAQAAERRYRSLVQATSQVVWRADPDGNQFSLVESLETVTGQPREKILERDWLEMVHPEDRERTRRCWHEAIQSQSMYLVEHRVLRRSGQYHHCISRGVPVLGEHGQIAEWVGTTDDIHEQRMAENALRESEERFRATFMHAAIGIVHAAPDGRILLANEQFCGIVGRSQEELYKLRISEVTHPADREYDQAQRERLLAGEIEFYYMEKCYLRKDGSVVWGNLTASLIRDPDGQPLYIIGVVEDITARRHAEMALRESEERFRVSFEHAGIGIAQMDLGGYFRACNPALCKMLGYAEEELVGHNYAEVTYLDDQASDALLYQTLLSTRQDSYQVEKRYIRKDGQLVWGNLTVSMVRDGRGQPLFTIGMLEDITARKRAEDELRQSEARLAEAQRLAHVGNYEFDWPTPGGVRWSEETFRIIGWPAPQPPSIEEYLKLVHPDDIPLMRQTIEEAVEQHRGFDIEYRLIRPDGQLIHIRSISQPTMKIPGQGSRIFGTILDITEHKRAEETLSQDARRKDEFLAMLAHELRNPLAPIRNAVQVLRQSVLNESNVTRQRQVIERQVTHMARLLDDLLDVSRITRGKIRLSKKALDLRQVVDHVTEMGRSELEAHNQRLSYTKPPEAVWVEGDETRLEQVFNNLLSNAIKYTESGGQIWISIETPDEATTVVRVRDTGIGIAPEMLPRVFDLFAQADQSLDRAQGGLGIGLTMVHNLVQLHGGHVEAHSPGAGQGSEFIVFLPLLAASGRTLELPADEPAASMNGAVPPPTRQGRPLRILIVDDNADTRQTMAELLSLWGYATAEADEGAKALEIARHWSPEVILLDIGLPGANGYQVARQLREDLGLRSAVLLALTGYGREQDLRLAEEAGFDDHFTKPVNFERLQEILRQASLRFAA